MKTSLRDVHELGIQKIALDSAGNAGASIAAYAAAADMECTVYVPDDISAGKLEQIARYGANIVKVPGGRMEACAAVKKNLGDAYYASHAALRYEDELWHPLSPHQKAPTLAGQRYIWLTTRLPMVVYYKNPVLFFSTTEEAVRVYMDNELIYSYGEFGRYQQIYGKKWHIVTLPSNYKGRQLSFQLYTDHPGRLGRLDMISLDEGVQQISHIFQHELLLPADAADISLLITIAHVGHSGFAVHMLHTGAEVDEQTAVIIPGILVVHGESAGRCGAQDAGWNYADRVSSCEGDSSLGDEGKSHDESSQLAQYLQMQIIGFIRSCNEEKDAGRIPVQGVKIHAARNSHCRQPGRLDAIALGMVVGCIGCIFIE